ncbi:glycoside hydrolase family 13 protein [Aquibacillus rhizosphaerae]|uniref:Glycoside hydrolase family 13 protein n=1 Tax=Aquibacillus rhizosphaerae TaxID=3051431 RepID=A0ABT7L1C6_9BACI|nr:glycoside hydrolase family 13 protein [Aquibacillus sp. LR5S19]MDL4839641.1 glycoside hydrolase family 13 protein [Aquibacillus sp. LR5S19]
MSIFHNSHDLSYRNPFGAVITNTVITIHLDSSLDNIDQAYFCWRKEGLEVCDRITMEVVELNQDITRFAARYQAPDYVGLVWYYFMIEHDGMTTCYGNNKQCYGGEGEENNHPTPYQITVYNQEYAPPAWLQGKVIYQIFVDRFYNGNNNGTIVHPKKNSVLHSHWDNDPVYIRGENGEILTWDFFGGNLLGIIKKLPYLSKLGIDIIYLNPIFEAPSNHKYDTGDYHQIDEMFGTTKTFECLFHEAKKYNIWIILDGVFSHTGSDSKYFNKDGNYPTLGAYQSTDSPFYSWYRFSQHPDEYDCWWGIDTLPNVNEMDATFIDFFIENEDSIINYWHRLGVKGWRLDVADELPDEFIKKLKKQLRKKDPDAILIGEVWEDASNKISYDERREYLLGQELDSVTNYVFRDIAIAFLLGEISASDVHVRLVSMNENYPKAHFFSLMNLIGTHDTPRILSILTNVSEEGTKNENGINRLKALSVWQLLFPGVPCIYYGDEAGVVGIEEPLNRRTYPWGKENDQLLDWYKKIISIQKKYDVFQIGDWNSFNHGKHVYGFKRTTETQIATVLISNSSDNQRIRLSENSESLVNVLTGCKYKSINGDVAITIRANEVLVLIS